MKVVFILCSLGRLIVVVVIFWLKWVVMVVWVSWSRVVFSLGIGFMK